MAVKVRPLAPRATASIGVTDDHVRPSTISLQSMRANSGRLQPRPSREGSLRRSESGRLQSRPSREGGLRRSESGRLQSRSSREGGLRRSESGRLQPRPSREGGLWRSESRGILKCAYSFPIQAGMSTCMMLQVQPPGSLHGAPWLL